MKHLIQGMSCSTCVQDLQAHKSQIPGLLKIRSSGDDILLETRDDVKGSEILNKIKEHLTHVGHNHSDMKIYESETIYLKGLTCANCSAKIEDETKKFKGVKNANFEFATEKYTIVFDESADFENVYEKLEKLVPAMEPGVVVSKTLNEDEHDHEHEHGEGSIKARVTKYIIIFAVLIGLHFVEIDEKISFVIYLLAYISVGLPVLKSAFKNILRGDFLDENFLMSIASIGAIVVGQYPEAVAVMLLYDIGEMFEDLALERSRKNISSALALKPDFANVIRNGEIIEVDPEEVNVSEIIVVKPGEKIPLDGIVKSGDSYVNTANVTGESVPRRTTVGDEAISGCVNTTGVLEIEVTSSYDDGTIAKILDLVENASARKAPVEKFITKFAKIYTPIVVGLAVLMVVVLPLTGILAFNDALFRACTFLVISCPCALVISVPLGVFSGIGASSTKGIFVKGGNYLEALSDVSDVVFDKTGTITKGVFEVTDIIPSEISTKEEVLELAAMGEYHSTHPIGRAILNSYNNEINIKEIEDFKEISGQGITYNYKNDKILVGNEKLLNNNNIKFNELDNKVATKVFVAKNDKFLGQIFVSDVLKDNIAEDIKRLKDRNINLTMLSGDTNETAMAIANEVGINNAYGNLLPEDKVNKLENIIENSKNKVIFVGDGVNDAPVIARADIGIAMGGIGSDSAVEAADIVLMTDEIGKISDAIDISKYTKKIVYQNILFALGVKFLVLILGALGYASMWAAVFADVGVTLIAILNAMRILKIKL
ncbi:heavy metal translocating P-type ATPase [Peptoniphilus stercorisuis]|uniref:Cd(2+)-exporting ATPase n=1 Tax=Peptoniphilus stercorisuis TaxID=1436965 RepID=A0ABS4KD65_9FIRM|nr:heavy metal translocating P-type ATPase [Peptoniphilus stercorisuis]MBP2025709.1 Cd2+/Zn2+-exporting ATPase [Peptoniphilus stercorisuis]